MSELENEYASHSLSLTTTKKQKKLLIIQWSNFFN